VEGYLVIVAFLTLFILGFPVVLAIGIPCIVYIFAKGLPVDLIAQRTLYALDSFPLVAVPVFLFVGSLMNSAGISRYIYRFADTAVGRLPGGLAQVNIFGSLIFAGMSGSALADIGGIGRIEIDAMKSKGFSMPFAAAVTSSSAIVGPIFPPSIPLIIYGTVTGVSVIQLLLGGILPGLLCVAMLMLMTGWLAVRRNYPRTTRWPTWAELWRDFKPAFPAIAAPLILIGGMLLGYFTPTEIASVTVLYAVLISSLFYRELTWQGVLSAAYETIRASAGILLIVAVAALFGWILSVEQVPQHLTGWMLSISKNPYVLLLIVNALLLVTGMFLDSTTAILVIAPIIAKPLVAAGVDPVHLGMVVVFNLMIGLLTPPMGLGLYLVSDIAKVTMKALLKEMAPYYVPLAVTLLLITYVPWLTTWIPRLAALI
jgi:tripartite ATP-independent transporter DctM subunit